MSEEKEFNQLLKDVKELLKSKKYLAIRNKLLNFVSPDIADLLEEVMDDVGLDEAIVIFRMLPKDISVDVFPYLDDHDQQQIIGAITNSEINYIIDELDFDDKIDVIDEMPANLVDKILEKATPNEREQINTFLNYPKDSAGSLMTPNYISITKDMTVGDALNHIRRVGMNSETIYTCYVKSEGRKLYGIVSLRKLVTNDESVMINDILKTDFVSVQVNEDREVVSEMFRKYGVIALPVVDYEGRIVGIITYDDIFEVIEEEATEDMERMVGVVDKTNTEYLDTSVLRHVRNRLPWLLVLMLSYVFTGAVINNYEDQLSTAIALVAYMPMLMGTGGNSGSQSATLIIRGLAVGDIDTKDAFRVFWKELRVSFLTGLVLSIINFARVYWFESQTIAVSLTVCIAMIAIVVAAKCIGSLLPLFAKKIGIDPALMANPLISSITDLISVTTYFMLATLFIGI